VNDLFSSRGFEVAYVFPYRDSSISSTTNGSKRPGNRYGETGLGECVDDDDDHPGRVDSKVTFAREGKAGSGLHQP
jgi:hypothetical protein